MIEVIGFGILVTLVIGFVIISQRLSAIADSLDHIGIVLDSVEQEVTKESSQEARSEREREILGTPE